MKKNDFFKACMAVLFRFWHPFSFKIVYADDAISKKRQRNKAVKGVIFVINGSKIFISDKYSEKLLSREQAEAYCSAIKVQGTSCTQGSIKLWETIGLLGFDVSKIRKINWVLRYLDCEALDKRDCATSSCNRYYRWIICNGDHHSDVNHAHYRVRPVAELS